jgi:hypothetical protein
VTAPQQIALNNFGFFLVFSSFVFFVFSCNKLSTLPPTHTNTKQASCLSCRVCFRSIQTEYFKHISLPPFLYPHSFYILTPIKKTTKSTGFNKTPPKCYYSTRTGGLRDQIKRYVRIANPPYSVNTRYGILRLFVLPMLLLFIVCPSCFLFFFAFLFFLRHDITLFILWKEGPKF